MYIYQLVFNALTGSFADFDSDLFNITIEAGEIIGYHNLSITCDELIEGNETFNLTLSLASDNDQITIGKSMAIVKIIDSTGKCYLEPILMLQYLHIYVCVHIIVMVNFNQSLYVVREDDGAVIVKVIMSKQSSQQLQVIISLRHNTTTGMQTLTL